MKNVLQPVLVLMAFVCVPAGGIAQIPEDKDYQVYIVTPTLNNHGISPDARLPKTCQIGDRLEITACRGEYEPASFVIETSTPLENAFVEAHPLTGESGVITKEAIDIRVAAPVFSRITDWGGATNRALVHDPDLITIKDEPWPIALVPDAPPNHLSYTQTTYFTRDPVDTPTLVPADIESRQQFWITVHVPQDTKSDTYETKFVFTADNASKTELTLVLKVPDFDLQPPAAEYSIYYPIHQLMKTEEEAEAARAITDYNVVSEKQYLLELRNMLEHGCSNPNVYAAHPLRADDGTLDLSMLENTLRLRKEAGVPATNLYLVSLGVIRSDVKITDQEYTQNVEAVSQVVDLAHSYGYQEVYFMGADEATGQRLIDQRRAWESVHEGGGKVFVAIDENSYNSNESVYELLDLPIIVHSIHGAIDGHFAKVKGDQFVANDGRIRSTISRNLEYPAKDNIVAQVHERGSRIITYMDPLAGCLIPDTHRRLRGLGMHKSGIDGTMTWAYTHIGGARNTQAGPMSLGLVFAFVVRGKEAPFDTLNWEAYREGYDDARYLATLQAAIVDARSDGRNIQLAQEAEEYIEGVSIHINLDIWRQKMIYYTEGLLSH